MIRAGVCGFILCQILTTSFADPGTLPVTVLRLVAIAPSSDFVLGSALETTPPTLCAKRLIKPSFAIP